MGVAYACGTCGYDLRGLNALGECPECGRAVWSSMPSPGSEEPIGVSPSGVRMIGLTSILLSWTAIGGIVLGGVAVLMGGRLLKRARAAGGPDPRGVRAGVWFGFIGAVLGVAWLLATFGVLGWMF